MGPTCLTRFLLRPLQWWTDPRRDLRAGLGWPALVTQTNEIFALNVLSSPPYVFYQKLKAHFKYYLLIKFSWAATVTGKLTPSIYFTIIHNASLVVFGLMLLFNS